jgi:hypothetical protein
VNVTRDISARKWAAGLALQLQAGANPKSTRPARPVSYDDKTLRRVVHEYFAYRGAWKSRVEFVRTMENHVLPVLGERVYESITRRDLAALRDGIIAKVRQKAIARAKTPDALEEAQNAGKHAAHNA